MRSLEETIDSIVVGAPERSLRRLRRWPPSDRARRDEPANTDMELAVFTRYLTNEAPTEYVGKQYRMALLARGLAKDDDFSSFDPRNA